MVHKHRDGWSTHKRGECKWQIVERLGEMVSDVRVPRGHVNERGMEPQSVGVVNASECQGGLITGVACPAPPVAPALPARLVRLGIM